ncbi:unnamed protein product, partial [Phaeothamnion confervicola]
MTRTRVLKVCSLAVLALILAGYVFDLPGRIWPPVDLTEAVQLAERGYFDDALDLLDEAIKAEPSNDATRILTAQVLINQFDSKANRENLLPVRRALEILDATSMKGGPTEVALIELWKGKAARRLLHLGKAEAHWKAALKADPTVPE